MTHKHLVGYALMCSLALSGWAAESNPPASRGARVTANDESIEECTVHVLGADYTKPDVSYPCGEWFEPEPGDHIVWLEGRNRISPTWSVVMVPQPPAKNELQLRMPTVDAALVSVDPRHFPERGTVRMVSFSGHNTAFERRVLSREEAARGVLMPVGMLIVATFGPDHRAIALAPLLSLKAGERYGFEPAALGSRGAIFAILEQPHKGRTRDTRVTLRRGNVEVRPDALEITDRRIYVVWSSVTPGDYTIDVGGMTLDNESASVVKDAVTTIRGKLKPETARKD